MYKNMTVKKSCKNNIIFDDVILNPDPEWYEVR